MAGTGHRRSGGGGGGGVVHADPQPAHRDPPGDGHAGDRRPQRRRRRLRPRPRARLRPAAHGRVRHAAARLRQARRRPRVRRHLVPAPAVGWAKAAEISYLGRDLDAAEAERLGLVNRVVPTTSSGRGPRVGRRDRGQRAARHPGHEAALPPRPHRGLRQPLATTCCSRRCSCSAPRTSRRAWSASWSSAPPEFRRPLSRSRASMQLPRSGTPPRPQLLDVHLPERQAHRGVRRRRGAGGRWARA